jgi:hypothetical protein
MGCAIVQELQFCKRQSEQSSKFEFESAKLKKEEPIDSIEAEKFEIIQILIDIV